MASSSSSAESASRRPKPLARHDSSFLGTIKNIVTAPLNWFAHQDGDSTPGKRRRASPSPVAPIIEDESSRQPKRMRVLSPPKPPRPLVVPRSSSAVLPSTRSRATLSPRRPPQPIARTMSIDPPRPDSSFNFGRDQDEDMNMLIDRDSRPPSPRPAFRMRSSLTPQPQQPPTRYISEPPPLNSLVSNPVFLHAPAKPAHETSPVPPTLGSIVESVRATNSPTRQTHSALILPSAPTQVNNENQDVAAERALQQLDVYKTPLLPTRLRSSNLPASVTATKTPEMFKSRRAAHFVLMHEDRDRPGRKVSGAGKSPVVNETKPYAGEGGMKKLLARRKQEEEEENEQDHGEQSTSPRQSPPVAAEIPPIPSGSDWFSVGASDSSATGSSLRVGRSKTSRNHIQRPSKARFSALYDEEADDTMEDDENRQKERQMLEEAAKKVPVFKVAPGFSFARDVAPIQPADLEKAKEPPISSLPFSFSKPPSVQTQSTSAASTSVEVPAAPILVPTPESKVNAPPAPATGGAIPNFFANSAVLAKAKETPPPTPPAFPTFAPSKPFSLAPTPSSQPLKDAENPFWDGDKKNAGDQSKSSLFAGFGKAPDAPPVMAAPASLFGNGISAFPPIKKAESAPQPLFSFDKPSSDESAAKPIFGAPSGSEPPKPIFSFGTPPSEPSKPPTEIVVPKSLFGADNTLKSFGAETSKAATPNLPQEQPQAAPPQLTPLSLPFSFGAPQSSTSAPFPTPAATTTTQPSLFGATSNAPTAAEAPKPLFGGSSGTGAPFSFGQPAAQDKEVKPASFAFGQPTAQDKDKDTKPAPFSFGTAAPQDKKEVKLSPFSFGPPAAQEKDKETKQPPFSFGPPAAQEKDKETKQPPFSFGQPVAQGESKEVKPSNFFGSAPVSAETKPTHAPFSFGQPSAPAPVSAPAASSSLGFSFSGGGSAASDVSNKPPFMFGQPATIAPTDRPVTPPKNADAEFRMEESPTRDLQQANGNKTAATLNGAFAFGTSGSSVLGGPIFGAAQSTTSPAPASTPFSFSAPSSNPFGAKESKPEEPKGFGGFGQGSTAPPINTSFSFGQTAKPAEDASRPSSGGGFTFGTTPVSATAPSPAFSFGAPANVGQFGQTNTGSAPSSPSTFNQPSPFAFGSTAPAASAPFAFGSQPNSPAAGANLTLPSSSTGFGGAGFGQTQQPSSPFSAPIALAPSTSGGGGTGGASLFTIGAAPAAPPAGARQIKKLPNRRGGAKR